jgi:hypothetical protein
MQIAMRAGQDSDCNPASTAGVLFTTLGFSRLPGEYTSGLDRNHKWDYTSYNFGSLIDVCEKLARQVVLQEGGRIEKDANGEDVLVIPVRQPQPEPLEQSWQPGPVANSTFTDGQLEQISQETNHVAFDLNRFAPGWQIDGCMDSPDLGIIHSAQGKQGVFFTFPASNDSPCRLTRTIDLPSGSHKVLNLLVSYSVGSWDLVVKANRQVLFSQNISKDTTQAGWLEVSVNLSAFAGQATELELLNQPAHSQWPGAFWASIILKDKS